MTEAEKLLQETKSAVVVAESQTEDICVIDSDLRIIGIPEQFKVLGVENDKDVKVMQFRIPKVYKGTDLSAFNISVNYQNSRGTKGRYVVADKRVSGDRIEFSWTVGSTAVKYKGDTKFIVCMRLTGSDGAIKKEFNTTLATMTILEGLEVDNPAIEQEEKDIIAQLLQIVDNKSKEAVQAVTAEGAKQIKAVQDAAQEVIADREQIKTNKADIADLRQTKAGAIINSAKGERIAVGDSADAFFEGLKLHGKSEQVTTTGAQMFNKENVVAGILENDGSIAQGSDLYTSNYIAVEPNTKYSCTATGSSRLKFYNVDKQPIQTDNFSDANVERAGVFETGETTKYVRFTVMGKYINAVMFNLGEKSLPYEPYTGGKPSPSQEYQQEFKSCGESGKIGIEVSGKNLLQESKIKRSKDNVYLFNDNNGFLVKKNENYALSFSNVANAIFLIEIGKNSSDAIKKVTNDKKLTFTATEDMNVYFNIYIPGASESITNIQFEYAKDPTNYEEMKSIQSMSVPTPNGLPGIKVDSGGNYTDSNGQQWVCDEMDFKRGKYVQRIKKMVLNDTGWWLTTKDKYQAFGLTVDDNKGGVAGMCDKFIHIDNVGSAIGFNTKTKGRIYLTTGHETLEELKAWLKGNPVTVVYALATPIEIDIPEETMQAYQKLYTNYPSTVVQNDVGAGMEVEYVADTKQFILDQIKAIVQS
ncbi:hypothetical protein [Mediterraneibacter gnavus]|uniref:hypothetical protein n=2 Tax=Mediterraneibacter gnavus TaxID=33038 RepID=UPI002330284F|nr:hypothetical protein [Mediterraneibacter gnavus]MDB8713835.1 hypothetical protein [Mediterraneibacter gnavus]